MSTRSDLKGRRYYFKTALKSDPTNEGYKKAIEEINFIFKALKEYDAERSKAT